MRDESFFPRKTNPAQLPSFNLNNHAMELCTETDLSISEPDPRGPTTILIDDHPPSTNRRVKSDLGDAINCKKSCLHHRSIIKDRFFQLQNRIIRVIRLLKLNKFDL